MGGREHGFDPRVVGEWATQLPSLERTPCPNTCLRACHVLGAKSVSVCVCMRAHECEPDTDPVPRTFWLSQPDTTKSLFSGNLTGFMLLVLSLSLLLLISFFLVIALYLCLPFCLSIFSFFVFWQPCLSLSRARSGFAVVTNSPQT